MKRLHMFCLLVLVGTMTACHSFAPTSAPVAPTNQPAARTETPPIAESAGATSSAPSAGAARLNKVHKGMAYADFRSALLADGWKPLPDLKCKAHVVGAAYKELCAEGSDSCKACDELPELSSCSGDAACLMRFQDAETHRQLDVNTYGDIGDRAVHGADSELNVTGWTVSTEAAH